MDKMFILKHASHISMSEIMYLLENRYFSTVQTNVTTCICHEMAAKCSLTGDCLIHLILDYIKMMSVNKVM
jgi:hypothetical protein